MTVVIISVLLISLLEVPSMLKKSLKKELIVFIVLAVIAIFSGIFYIKNPNIISIAEIMLSAYESITGGGAGK